MVDLFKIAFLLFSLRNRPGYSGRKALVTAETITVRHRPKPEWVREEVIRLKAFMIHEGGRKIADTFNRLHAVKDRMTVGKTYVYKVILHHQYEIHVLRKKIKNKKPKPLPKNLIWSLDLTQVADKQKQLHTLFGMVDSGTRGCLTLEKIGNKASITLLRIICNAIERFGKPRIVRTDNEAVFISRLFRFGLYLLGIKHQRTEKCCPWMNGKIERLFGTLKNRLRHYGIKRAQTLADDLAVFRFWYNHARTHQYLNGRTPAEVWNKAEPDHKGKHFYFSAWNGALAGFYIPPS